MKIKTVLVVLGISIASLQTRAGCGPPQCTIYVDQIEHVVTSLETCMTSGIFVGDIFKEYNPQRLPHSARLLKSGNPSVIRADSSYDLATGICTYDYTVPGNPGE